MRTGVIIFALLSAIGFGSAGVSWIVKQSMASKAVLVQRVQKDAASDLFDDGPGTPIGSPQMLIIADPKAFIEGEGPEGSRLVDENYLVENKIYPLQLKTIEFISKIIVVAGVSAGTLFLLLTIWMRKRLQRRLEQTAT